jgi:tRNA (guanine10-N2)-methyltransferase
MKGASSLLVRFKDRHEEMAFAELSSLFLVLGGCSDLVFGPADRYPFVHVSSQTTMLTPELCRQVCARSMLVEGFYEVFGSGVSYDALMQNLDVEEFKKQAYGVGVKLCVSVEVYGSSLTQKEKSERIFRVLSVLTKRVKVDLKNPTLNLFIFEQMRSRNNVHNELVRVFFGAEVARNCNTLQADYSLKERKFLNTTTMDPCLSFVMANQALCRRGSLVFDPFVGSGSVLVACAHFGAVCAGSDYDPRVFNDAETGLSIRDNFGQYGFAERFVGAVRADFSQRWLRRGAAVFDAIVTDPPYGVREGIKKIGRKPSKPRKPQPNEDAAGYVHVPMRVSYPYRELLQDLTNLAADTLVPGGRSQNPRYKANSVY